MDWLDQDLLFREGREAARADDGGTSNSVSRHGSSIAQGRDIGSSRKSKAPRIIVSNTSSDDGDDRAIKGGSNIVGDSKDSEDTSGDNGAGGGIGVSGVVDSCYVNQVDHGMSWVQGNGIIMPHKILIMDIGQAYGNNESTWKDSLHFLVMMTIPVGIIIDRIVTRLISTSNPWL